MREPLTPSMLEDARLVRARDLDALYRKHERQARRVACRMIGCRNGPDVAQDAWVQVCGKLATLKRPELFASWLLRTVHCLCLNWKRGQRFRSHEHLSAMPEPGTFSETPIELLDVRQAIVLLPEQQRRAVALFCDGLTDEQAAEATGLKESGAKYRRQQAFATLRKQLA